ncbi:MAG TPA: response regulator [Deltaproteobacteria bacterium]|jgi:CheY-like chemotaxis protein/anti-sigma regulatory factor (Ser/Thr protein kinase)|nr:response regulator [Deltaproteobacteria bacterium]HOI07631.1 response regulator [Deltaproteobacteria bacterium]
MEELYEDFDASGNLGEVQASVLVVDDEPLNVRLMVGMLQKENYRISVATSGEEAWELMERSPSGFDAVLMDRIMPGIDGLEVLRRMKGHDELKTVPVIFQTAMTREDEILEGIQAGAYYYLTKPYRREKLIAVVKTAVADHIQYITLRQETNQTMGAIGLLNNGDFTVQHLEEADNLAALLANICPEPDKVVLGLWELLINAVEHGNLNISYEEKSELLQRNIWRQEVDRRTRLPENAGLKVNVHFERTNSEIVITIEDMGPGFDWKPFLDFSPDRVFDTHGRGIAIAGNYSFHHLEYLGKGNKVRAVIKCA